MQLLAIGPQRVVGRLSAEEAQAVLGHLRTMKPSSSITIEFAQSSSDAYGAAHNELGRVKPMESAAQRSLPQGSPPPSDRQAQAQSPQKYFQSPHGPKSGLPNGASGPFRRPAATLAQPAGPGQGHRPGSALPPSASSVPAMGGRDRERREMQGGVSAVAHGYHWNQGGSSHGHGGWWRRSRSSSWTRDNLLDARPDRAVPSSSFNGTRSPGVASTMPASRHAPAPMPAPAGSRHDSSLAGPGSSSEFDRHSGYHQGSYSHSLPTGTAGLQGPIMSTPAQPPQLPAAARSASHVSRASHAQTAAFAGSSRETMHRVPQSTASVARAPWSRTDVPRSHSHRGGGRDTSTQASRFGGASGGWVERPASTLSQLQSQLQLQATGNMGSGPSSGTQRALLVGSLTGSGWARRRRGPLAGEHASVHGRQGGVSLPAPYPSLSLAAPRSGIEASSPPRAEGPSPHRASELDEERGWGRDPVRTRSRSSPRRRLAFSDLQPRRPPAHWG